MQCISVCTYNGYIFKILTISNRFQLVERNVVSVSLPIYYSYYTEILFSEIDNLRIVQYLLPIKSYRWETWFVLNIVTYTYMSCVFSKTHRVNLRFTLFVCIDNMFRMKLFYLDYFLFFSRDHRDLITRSTGHEFCLVERLPEEASTAGPADVEKIRLSAATRRRTSPLHRWHCRSPIKLDDYPQNLNPRHRAHSSCGPGNIITLAFGLRAKSLVKWKRWPRRKTCLICRAWCSKSTGTSLGCWSTRTVPTTWTAATSRWTRTGLTTYSNRCTRPRIRCRK